MKTELVWARIQTVLAAAGGWIGYALGGLDGMLIALLVLMGMDYFTGVLCAISEKKLSSSIGFKGICKKVLILMLVAAAHVVDLYVIGEGGAVRGVVLCFYLSNEGVSMLENTARLGLPIPEKLKEVLSQLHKKEDAK